MQPGVITVAFTHEEEDTFGDHELEKRNSHSVGANDVRKINHRHRHSANLNDTSLNRHDCPIPLVDPSTFQFDAPRKP